MAMASASHGRAARGARAPAGGRAGCGARRAGRRRRRRSRLSVARRRERRWQGDRSAGPPRARPPHGRPRRRAERRPAPAARNRRLMSVATLYDVHGNLPALEAVLHEIPGEATIVIGGDVVAGGDDPGSTLQRLRALGDRVVWIRGNADRELYRGEEGLAPPGVLDETKARLSDEQISFLYALPPTALIDGVLYCHATPRNDVDIFTERTPEDSLLDIFEGVDADVVVCGHTHTQFERTIAGKRVVNSGSVGMPYEDEPGAYWTLDLEHRWTPYEGASLLMGREEAVALFTERGL